MWVNIVAVYEGSVEQSALPLFLPRLYLLNTDDYNVKASTLPGISIGIPSELPSVG